MRRFLISVLALGCMAFSVLAQSADSHMSPFHLGLDLQTKYIWRGMEMIPEESAPVVFPGFNYARGGFYAYVLGGYSLNGKYAEVDLGLSYTWRWLTLELNDYYYPTVSGLKDRYFNFNGADTGHWLEAVFKVAPETVPVSLTVSNFFYGADKDLEGKQAYSTYVELGGHLDFANSRSLALAVGAALNKSCYNGYEKGFGICNVELKYTHPVVLKSWTLPLSAAYIINPVYRKSFVNFTASLAF